MPHLRLLRIFLAAFLFLTSLGPAPAQAHEDDLAHAIDEYLTQTLAVAPVPGIAIAVVRADGPVYVQGYGQAGPGRPATPQTPFWIASLSKPFTALAVWQLINAGKLDLDAPVQEYIPWFTLADPEAAAKIHIRHLLNHTSGIPQADGGKIYVTASPQDTREDLVRGLKDIYPNRAVGLSEYSNYNYIVLGYLIEVVTGQAYPAYMQEHIFQPLGMNHTFLDNQAALADGGVIGYQQWFGLPMPWGEPYKPSMQSSGYILSSAEDMGQFARLYLNNGSLNGASLVGAEPPAGEGYYDIYWDWIGGPSRKATPGHQGAMQTNSSAIRIHPTDGFAVVVLMNARPDYFFGTLNAQVVLEGITGIVQGRIPAPPNNRTFQNRVLQLNLILGGLVAALLASLTLTAFWQRHPTRRRLRRAVLAAGALDIGLALLGLVGIPLSSQVSWPILLQISPDYNGAALVLSILFAGSAAWKILRFVVGRPRLQAVPA